MCGRFVSAGDPAAVADYMNALQPSLTTEPVAEPLGENFNVAPTHSVLAVVGDEDGAARVDSFHWGLIPSWAKDRKIASKMINARAETLDQKPAFKKLFQQRRCLIPMDGFYEWKPGTADGPLDKKGKPRKQPMFIHRDSGATLLVAGLWTRWKDPEDDEGRWLQSTTIVTTGANDTMAPVHNRMPVVVPADRWSAWLDPTNHDTTSLVELFAVSDDGGLTMHPVSTEVNNVRNKGAHLVDEIDPDDQS